MKYFELISGLSDWPHFNGQPTPTTKSPVFDIFEELRMSEKDFVNKANELFNEYSMKVPSNYPKLRVVERNLLQHVIETNPMNDFAICVGSCILIKEEFGIDVSKIIRKELIEPNSRSGILHANSMASIALAYLRNGSSIVIPKEQKNQSNPDLVIDGFDCEVKVIEESDWTADIDLSTGIGKQRLLSEDLCYDIGQFISKRGSGHKGIRQSDIIFADLSLKSFGWIERMTGIKNRVFPDLKKHRIIYFAKKITEFLSFYLDFDPSLWNLIKTSNKKHRFGIFPPPKAAT